MSVGEIAGLIAAIAFVALVALTAVPLLKLGRVLEEVRLAVRDIGHESVPILTELRGTVRATNDELDKLGLVTEDVAKVSRNATVVTENAAQMSTPVRRDPGRSAGQDRRVQLRHPQGDPRRQRDATRQARQVMAPAAVAVPVPTAC